MEKFLFLNFLENNSLQNKNFWLNCNYLGSFQGAETGPTTLDGAETKILKFENTNFPEGNRKVTVGRSTKNMGKLELFAFSRSNSGMLTYGLISDEQTDSFTEKACSQKGGSAVRRRKKTKRTIKKTKRRKTNR